jgi:hypothetical protein
MLLLCIVKPLQTKFPSKQKVVVSSCMLCMCNLYRMTRRLLGYSYVMTHAEAMYKQACVTRFTMKQQFMKLNKRKRLNVGTYQRFYESVHHYHFFISNDATIFICNCKGYYHCLSL